MPGVINQVHSLPENPKGEGNGEDLLLINSRDFMMLNEDRMTKFPFRVRRNGETSAGLS